MPKSQSEQKNNQKQYLMLALCAENVLDVSPGEPRSIGECIAGGWIEGGGGWEGERGGGRGADGQQPPQSTAAAS